MDRIESYIKNRKLMFRTLCVIISVSMIISLVGVSANMMPDKVLYTVFILYFISIFPMAIIGIEVFIDRILYFNSIIISLLVCSSLITRIVDIIFNNPYINVYFGITAFFVFGYLYSILFREDYKHDYVMICSFPIPKSQSMKSINKEFAKMAALIGYFCTVLRIPLLILAVFEKQYHWGLLEYPISEAVVTSLAFEKLIKIHYKELGTPLD